MQIEADAHEVRVMPGVAGSLAAMPMTSNIGTSGFPAEAVALPTGGHPTLAYQLTSVRGAFLSPTCGSAGPGLWTSAALPIFGSPIVDRNYLLPPVVPINDLDWGSILVAPKRRGRSKKRPLVPPDATNDD